MPRQRTPLTHASAKGEAAGRPLLIFRTLKMLWYEKSPPMSLSVTSPITTLSSSSGHTAPSSAAASSSGASQVLACLEIVLHKLVPLGCSSPPSLEAHCSSSAGSCPSASRTHVCLGPSDGVTTEGSSGVDVGGLLPGQ